MIRWLTLCYCLFLTAYTQAQNYQPLKNRLNEVVAIGKAGSPEKLDSWWADLRAAQQIPLVVEDSVYFFYKGPAKSVDWIGDFNGWGYDKKFPNKGKQVEGTDVWLLKASFPKDARLDYKIVIDGTNWMIDPENKYQQWSGVGGGSPNSELRMPSWQEDPILTERNSNQKGTLKSDILLNSKILGYQVTYTVYLPHHYRDSLKLPCIYVTDGYEYLHPRLGNMITILDNLIEDKKIKPVVAVFIDHRSPIDRSNNRRMQELAMNAKYLEFFTQELIPQVESEFAVIRDSGSRAIMGTSMGGLTATYFAFTKPDIFGLAGIQSPSFYTRPQIYSLCSNPADPKMKISMTSGLINDTSVESRKMKDVLEATSCVYTYREVNEGHSWGNWRRLIDDILIDLFAQTK
jgi:enterochelin esterase family protein